MQEHLFRHFSSMVHIGFLNDVSITFIDKTDPSDPLKQEDYWRRTVGLMQDVMKSLPSDLIYCYCCLYLFILFLSIVSMYKPVY